MEKQFNVIYMGRVAVGLYNQQIDAHLENMPSFAKYLGGSSGNVAYGTTRQGLCSSMLARVGDEHMERFLREGLSQVGCNINHLITDKNHLTVLVLLGIKDRDTSPLIFYRDNYADMAVTASDVDEQYIVSARCLAITGTRLSRPQTRETVLTTLTYARRHGMRTALDIDYHPALWGLTSLGDDETRFIAADQITRQLQEVLRLFDIIVGTGEESHIAGSSTDTLQVLSQIRGVSHATLVCKRSTLGYSVYTDVIPARPDDGLTMTGVRAEVLNVLGTGDAFMSSLLRSYLNNEGREQACRYANAYDALVVSRHGCASAMPSKVELDDYLSHTAGVPHPDLDPHLNHSHRMTTRRRTQSELCVMAFGHHSQLEDTALQCGASLERIPVLEQLVLQVSREATNSAGLESKAGLLCDDALGQDTLNAITREGWWIGRPIELSGSRPLETEHGNIGLQLISWPQEHVVKCLIFFHPEDTHALRLEQEQGIAEVHRAYCQSGHELLLKAILPASIPRSDELYLRAASCFYNLGIHPDWWKLSPLTSAGQTVLSDVIERRDPHCHGVVILGLDVPVGQPYTNFKAAAGHGVVKRFAVGRTLFSDAPHAWLKHDADDAQLVARVKDNCLQLIAWWHERGQT